MFFFKLRIQEKAGEIGGLGEILLSLEHVWKFIALQGRKKNVEKEDLYSKGKGKADLQQILII